TLAAGARIEQSVSLTLSGSTATKASSDGRIALKLGERIGEAPALGLGLDPDEIPATRSVASTIAEIRPQHLVCHYDPRRGHDRHTLEQEAGVAPSLGAIPWLEVLITTVGGFGEEIDALGAAAAAIGSPFRTVLLSPTADLKSTLPGSVWPPAPPAAQ